MSYGGIFDAEKLQKKLEELQKEMQDPTFWNNTKHAQKVTKEVNLLQQQLEKNKRFHSISDELETYQMLLEEEMNINLFEEAQEDLRVAQKYLASMESQFLLNKETDINSAVLTIHPGAGGTESQDWAEMLLRMYLRWAENENFKIVIIDQLPGDEAGIKSVTIEVLGDYAFGFLKSETGIHRLVRISPFNAQGKRQTSFASVFVYPIIEDEIDVEIDTKDLRIDTYRASGKGGQGVNTTDSAVRITHLPTNIVVQCQNERSQLKNKDTALKILKSRLYQKYEEEREKERQEIENGKTDIGWGNQIRSYVFHPYQMVKDHRTNHETGNANAVMNGDLNDFMQAYLKMKAENKARKK